MQSNYIINLHVYELIYTLYKRDVFLLKKLRHPREKFIYFENNRSKRLSRNSRTWVFWPCKHNAREESANGGP